MTRKTKAQFAAEREAFLAQQVELAKAEYPARLMAMLDRAVKQNFELTVHNVHFVLEDRDDRRSNPFVLSWHYSKVNEDTLNELEWRLNDKEEAGREAQRRIQVRNAALSKLTQEEREILGV